MLTKDFQPSIGQSSQSKITSQGMSTYVYLASTFPALKINVVFRPIYNHVFLSTSTMSQIAIGQYHDGRRARVYLGEFLSAKPLGH